MRRSLVGALFLLIAANATYSQLDRNASAQNYVQQWMAHKFSMRIEAGKLTSKDIPALINKAESGDGRSQVLLGLAFELGQGIEQNYGTAVRWFRKAAEQGDPEGKAYLGSAYISGLGVSRNVEEGLRWYHSAAEQGNVGSQMALWGIYGSGESVPQDKETAVRWLRKAAEQGDPLAESLMGDSYSKGSGVSPDEKEATAWYRRAAEHGDGAAQETVGKRYFSGFTVPPDHGEALRWFLKAAEQVGNTESQFHAGTMLADGDGAPADLIEAYKWLSVVCEFGLNDAFVTKSREALKTLKQKMSPEQIAEGQRRVDEWVPISVTGLSSPADTAH